MDAPIGGLCPQVFDQAIRDHVDLRYQPDGEGGMVCKGCGAQIMMTTGYISVHSAEFGDLHAGSGQVVQVPLPYCPQCEGEPKVTQSCVHLPLASAAAPVTLIAVG